MKRMIRGNYHKAVAAGLLLATIGAPIQMAVGADAAVPPEPAASAADARGLGRMAGMHGYFALPDGADYEMVMSIRETGPPRAIPATITRHKDWAKLVSVDGDAKKTDFIYLPGPLLISDTENRKHGGRYLSIRRPSPEIASAPIDYVSRKTGRLETVVGEACELWQVYSGSSWTRLGCITADGIELSRRTESGLAGTSQEAVAISLKRRRVAPSEVRPPSSIIDMSTWLATPLRVGQEPPGGDLEVMYTWGAATRIIRRHGEWTYDQTQSNNGEQTISVSRRDGRLHLTANYGRDGTPQSLIVSSSPQGGGDRPRLIPTGEPPHKVGALECTWMKPDPAGGEIVVTSGGEVQCHTADGIVLEMAGGHWTQYYWTARAISRRKLAMADMMPPPGVFDLRTWGVRGLRGPRQAAASATPQP